MRTTIYFIRHAEAQTNVSPLFKGEMNILTEVGVQQAKNLGAYFQDIHVSQIFTSDILRARLTAEEIGTALKKEVVVLPLAGERKVRYLDGSTYEYLEAFAGFNSRLTEIKAFFEALPQGHFIFVGHAIFLKALIANLILGGEISEDSCERISDSLVMDNARVSKCIYNQEKRKWRIASLNESGLIP